MEGTGWDGVGGQQVEIFVDDEREFSVLFRAVSSLSSTVAWHLLRKVCHNFIYCTLSFKKYTKISLRKWVHSVKLFHSVKCGHSIKSNYGPVRFSDSCSLFTSRF